MYLQRFNSNTNHSESKKKSKMFPPPLKYSKIHFSQYILFLCHGREIILKPIQFIDNAYFLPLCP